MSVSVAAPFYLSKLFTPYFNEGGSIINISSSRDRMSQPQTESYTAAKGGHCRPYSCAGCQSRGQGAGKFHLSRMDRHFLRKLWRAGRNPAACPPGGQSAGHREHGALPLLRQGGIHHGGKHLHRWRHDPAHDLSWRQRVGIEGMIAVISAAALCPEIPEHSGSRVFRSPFAAVYYYGLTTPCSPDTSAAYPKTPWPW